MKKHTTPNSPSFYAHWKQELNPRQDKIDGDRSPSRAGSPAAFQLPGRVKPRQGERRWQRGAAEKEVFQCAGFLTSFGRPLGSKKSSCSSTRCILLVDEVHLADDSTIKLLAELVREIGAPSRVESGQKQAPLRLALSFRSESPFRAALAPLLDALAMKSECQQVLELPPVSQETVRDWLPSTPAPAIPSRRIKP